MACLQPESTFRTGSPPPAVAAGSGSKGPQRWSGGHQASLQCSARPGRRPQASRRLRWGGCCPAGHSAPPRRAPAAQHSTGAALSTGERTYGPKCREEHRLPLHLSTSSLTSSCGHQRQTHDVAELPREPCLPTVQADGELLVLELCATDLERVLAASKRPLAPAAAQSIFVQLAQAVAACHRAGEPARPCPAPQQLQMLWQLSMHGARSSGIRSSVPESQPI